MRIPGILSITVMLAAIAEPALAQANLSPTSKLLSSESPAPTQTQKSKSVAVKEPAIIPAEVPAKATVRVSKPVESSSKTVHKTASPSTNAPAKKESAIKESNPGTSAVTQKVVVDDEPILTGAQIEQAISSIRKLNPILPIEGFDIARIRGSFSEARGTEKHEAADFVMPRNTPVRAVCDGKIAKLFESKAGGITVYQFDPSERYVFYYAHLEKYQDGLTDGMPVKRGDIIGYVGTSGNAPKDTPHLHFSIGVMDQRKSWSKAAELDPYEVFKKH